MYFSTQKRRTAATVVLITALPLLAILLSIYTPMLVPVLVVTIIAYTVMIYKILNKRTDALVARDRRAMYEKDAPQVRFDEQ